MSGAGKVACVTGASGYFASWLVKLLLQRGYTVNATVRNLSDPNKVAHLKELEGADERLHLFEANLIEDGSFDSAVHGCEAVFHTASPAFLKLTDPQAWYFVSKTLAEEAAWKFAKENDIELVVMNPGFVIGPLLQPTLNLSSESFLTLIKGKGGFPSYQFVDVRDVAEAHILGFENPSASGRYLLVGRVLTRSEALEILEKLYPSMDVPKIPAGDPTYQVCNKRAQDLGVVFTPFEVSLKDMVENLKEKNFLS